MLFADTVHNVCTLLKMVRKLLRPIFPEDLDLSMAQIKYKMTNFVLIVSIIINQTIGQSHRFLTLEH